LKAVASWQAFMYAEVGSLHSRHASIVSCRSFSPFRMPSGSELRPLCWESPAAALRISCLPDLAPNCADTLPSLLGRTFSLFDPPPSYPLSGH
jgi:hypothetical protein